jgi:hypothetical protein
MNQSVLRRVLLVVAALAVLLACEADTTGLATLDCHSARCGAAADATRKAVAAGYRRVALLPAGITGWAQAGQPVEPPPKGGRS